MAQTTYDGVPTNRNGTTVTRGSDTTFTATADAVSVVINTDNVRNKVDTLKTLKDVMAVISKDLVSATDTQDLPTTGSVTT